MQTYINQLLADIEYATQNVTRPFATENLELHDWMPDKEEDETAPVKELEEWTGIYKEQLPPHERLTDEQVGQLLKALNDMLNAYNWHFVLQITVPERIQYETIRTNFSQPARQKRWHMGFFELCP